VTTELNSKFEKSYKSLKRTQTQKQLDFQHRQEKEAKKTLRSKICKFLAEKTPILCGEYQHKHKSTLSKAEKFKEYGPEKHREKYKVPAVGSLVPQGGFMTPDEVLVRYFTEDELRMIQEDPNYFIVNEQYRDEITLFTMDRLESVLDHPDEANMTIKQKFHNKLSLLGNSKCEFKKNEVERKF
jgi:hypothetical protein